MLDIIGAELLLRNTASAEPHVSLPQPDDCPLTKSENRVLKLDRGVCDLVFKGI